MGKCLQCNFKKKEADCKKYITLVLIHIHMHICMHTCSEERKKEKLNINSYCLWIAEALDVFLWVFFLIRNSEFFSEVQHNILKPSKISSLRWWSSDSCIKWRLWHFTLPPVKWIIRFFHLQNELLNYHSGVMHWNSPPHCCSSIIKPCSCFHSHPPWCVLHCPTLTLQ